LVDRLLTRTPLSPRWIWPHYTSVKGKRDEAEWQAFAAVSPRTCMGWDFPLKLYGRCAVTPTREPRRSTISRAAEPGVQNGMRKLEASITRGPLRYIAVSC
jgi:hypothetical protein